jgi:membrane protein implicated in regulation of membrane protease activity
MLTLYLVCLLIGGTLIAGSAVLGGHDQNGIDHGLDHEAPAELNAGDEPSEALVAPDSAHELALAGSAPLWSPFFSIRFWTFFLAFFGLTGAVLTGLGLWSSQTLIAPAALAMGFGSGYGVSYVLGRLRRDTVSSSLQEQDYIGASGRVLLPISRQEQGKIRLEIQGRIVDLIAETEDEQPLVERQEVLVYAVERGVLKVTAPGPPQLSDSVPSTS